MYTRVYLSIPVFTSVYKYKYPFMPLFTFVYLCMPCIHAHTCVYQFVLVYTCVY